MWLDPPSCADVWLPSKGKQGQLPFWKSLAGASGLLSRREGGWLLPEGGQVGEAGTQKPLTGDWEAGGMHGCRHFACHFPGVILQMSLFCHQDMLPSARSWVPRRFPAALRPSPVVSFRPWLCICPPYPPTPQVAAGTSVPPGEGRSTAHISVCPGCPEPHPC